MADPQPDREFTLTELSALTGAAPSQVHGEVTRLTTAGWALDRRVGRSRPGSQREGDGV